MAEYGKAPKKYVIKEYAGADALRDYLSEPRGIELGWLGFWSESKVAQAERAVCLFQVATPTSAADALAISVFSKSPRGNMIKWVHSRAHAGRGGGFQRRLDDYLFNNLRKTGKNIVDSPAYGSSTRSLLVGA